MTITSGDKHQYIQFTVENFNSEGIQKLANEASSLAEDVIIDLSKVGAPQPMLVAEFISALGPLLDENIVILVGDEDELEKLGFLAEEFPVTPTYNEAMDFLFMMQLEKDLGIDE